MAEPEETNRPQHREGAGPGAKRLYVKPEFRHEKVFETMALSCGKMNVLQGQCRLNRNVS